MIYGFNLNTVYVSDGCAGYEYWIIPLENTNIIYTYQIMPAPRWTDNDGVTRLLEINMIVLFVIIGITLFFIGDEI